MWYEGNPCNMHLNDLAAEVKAGVEEAGMVGYRFNTIGVSDGISMGTDGMSYSLQSREIIADSVETVMRAQWYDGNVSLPGCDKNMPGTVIGMCRVNRPALVVYGGTIKPGESHLHPGEPLDVVSAFQSFGAWAAGKISEEERRDVVRHSCPGAGACGGMYTANTMASAIEALGLSLPYSSSTPAEDPLKKLEARVAGRYLRNLLEKDIKPLDILTRQSFHNAMVLTIIMGGSTNAVLHLIAMAAAAGIKITLDDFQKVSDETPFLADLKPSGKYVMEDVHKVRGKRDGKERKGGGKGGGRRQGRARRSGVGGAQCATLGARRLVLGAALLAPPPPVSSLFLLPCPARVRGGLCACPPRPELGSSAIPADKRTSGHHASAPFATSRTCRFLALSHHGFSRPSTPPACNLGFPTHLHPRCFRPFLLLSPPMVRSPTPSPLPFPPP